MSYNKETGMYEGWIYIIQSVKSENTYVGQTMQNPQRRWKEHIRDCFVNQIRNPLYDEFIKYGIDSFYMDPIRKIECNTKQELKNELNILERYYIAAYDSFHNGNNSTKGGAGFLGCGNPTVAYNKEGDYICETDTAIEMSERFGISVDIVVKCCSGIMIPRGDYIFRYKGDAFDKYGIIPNESRNAPVYCFDNRGNFLKHYDRLKDAADDLGLNYGAVRAAFQNNRIYHGFYFNSHKSFDYQKKRGKSIKVDLYNSDNRKLLGSFESISDGLIFLNKDNPYACVTSVMKCLNGKRKTAYGYSWKRHGEPIEETDHIRLASVMRPVNVYDLNDNYVNVFPSQLIAAKMLGCDPPSVNACLKKRHRSTKGYKFFYSNDFEQPDLTKVKDISAAELIATGEYNV